MGRQKSPLKVAPAPTLDVETRVREDQHKSLRLWLRLLACSNFVESHVRQRLQASFGTTLPRFDFLAQLDRVPEGLKMKELSGRLMVTGGNVTGIADMLEREGLIVREADPDDGRVFRVKLTKEGQRQFRRMAAEHERWVVALFEDVAAKDKDRLIELLGLLKGRLASAARP